MKNISNKIFDLLTGSESRSQISSLPFPLSPSFNLLLEIRPDHFDPVTVVFLESGEVRLRPGFDYSLDLTIRADPETWEGILSGRATLLSEFFAGRARFRNQRTAWNRFCLLSYLLSGQNRKT